ncbi:MAG: nitronate monooxygenase [Gaiellaceae bacterium]
MILDDLRHPIVLAPLAGGPSTSELVAAVSEAGGLGFVAAGYLSAETLRDQIRAVRALTTSAFGVNVFVPGEQEVDEAAVGRYLDRLRPEAQHYGVELGVPRFDDDDWQGKLSILQEDPVAVVSFTFGCPTPETIASLRRENSEIWVTITDVAEARAARDAGADVLVLQGFEAGGHRASWEDSDAGEELSVLALLRLVGREIDRPVVAAGGIADGAGVAAVLAAGAAAAQVGSAFLRALEAGTNPAHAAALATATPTAITRAFTGRRARGLVNRFLADHSAQAPSAYPHIHHATAPLRAEARSRGDADGFNLWAGQTHRLADAKPAAEIVRALSRDARAALEDAARRFPRR